MLDINQIYLGDCLDLIKQIDSQSVNLIIADPPYNIKKDTWDRIPDYINWLGTRILEIERVLKDNGSFYLFHNDMPQLSKIMVWIENHTRFVFKQFIVWNKRFDKAKNKGFLDGFIETNQLRNYQKMAEYCLFYTFQDDTGLSMLHNSRDCFQSIKDYLRQERAKTGLTLDQINTLVGTASMAGRHYFSDSQFCFPIKEHYLKLQSTGFFQKSYESLRQEYESLRYTFNNQKSHHSVWNYEVSERNDHTTPKPIPLIENIILHSSNPQDIILDPFLGSGSTALAAIQTNRNYIGIEIDPDYVSLAQKRVCTLNSSPRLF